MTEVVLCRQNKDLKNFLFFPAHPLWQSDGSLSVKWPVADYVFMQSLSQASRIHSACTGQTEEVFQNTRLLAHWIMRI